MSEVNRRRVVGGAVALGTLPVLAACGNDDGGATASDPGATSAPPAGGSAGGSGGGEALVATSEVPVGGGFVDTERKIVVSQPSEGEFKAFTTVCTHQGCAMDDLEGDTIVCSCHFSTFSLADGSVLDGPAEAPLEAIAVSVDGDEVVLD